MLRSEPRFDLRRDVEADILRKEASVCRVTGEAFRCPRSAAESALALIKNSDPSLRGERVQLFTVTTESGVNRTIVHLCN